MMSLKYTKCSPKGCIFTGDPTHVIVYPARRGTGGFATRGVPIDKKPEKR
jgi:hypothetical protein